MGSVVPVEGFDTLLHQLQYDLAPSPTSSDLSSSNTNNVHASSHPPLPQSKPHQRRGYPPIDTSKPGMDISNLSINSKPLKRGTHRRARSETMFRPPDHYELGLEHSSDSLTFSDESGEDLLSSYLKMDTSIQSIEPIETLASNDGGSHALMEINNIHSIHSNGNCNTNFNMMGHSRPPSRHRHSMSMDGSISIIEDLLGGDGEFLETKKPMDNDQLAELALVDPKRAKRILANRQSAARSKERKMKYTAELEQKVQTLQKEADSLASQLSILQRDTKGLTTENNELKLRLQSMEQQAQLRDALNETLKEEVKWLKSATVQMSPANGHNFRMGVHHQGMDVSSFQVSQITPIQQTDTMHTNSAGFPWQQAPAALDFSRFS